MGSITEKLEYLAATKEAIKEAIVAKGVEVADTDTFRSYAERIGDISGGSSSAGVAPKEVNFYDYDGTCVAAYTVEEAQALTALPDAPTHSGLTFQEWNYTLEKVNATTRRLNVGATYTTDDGDTRIYLHIADTARNEFPLCFSQSAANGVSVDWGDGSAAETAAGTTNVTLTHTYAAAGDYVIRLTPSEGVTISFNTYINGGSSNTLNPYRDMIRKVELGDGVTSIGSSAFQQCFSLASATLPASVTSIGSYAFIECYALAAVNIPAGVTTISSYAFSRCYPLVAISIPDGVTSIGSYGFLECLALTEIVIPDKVTSIGSSAFYSCSSLKSVFLPDSVTKIESRAFYECRALASINIPDGVTSIGSSAFYRCYNLVSIPLPSNVTAIGSAAFSECISLETLVIPDGVTAFNTNLLYYCHSLKSVTIPDGMTSIGTYAFYYCRSLASINIPDSVKTISSYAFQYCHSLASVTIPANVSTISTAAFQYCYGVKEYHLLPTTPPTLSSTNAFSGISSDCVIYVPQGCLEAYQAATNWAEYADYMQEEY